MIEALWLNGQRCSALPPALRGLHYGDGVFRTGLIWQGRILDADRHIDHLCRDAAQLGMQAPPAALLASELAETVLPGRGVLKLMLSRIAGGRGYRPSGSGADRLMFRYEAPAYPSRLWEQGVRLADSAVNLSANPRLAGAKHLNRLEQVLASTALDAEAEELLQFDEAGHVIGGTRSNLFWGRAHRLLTPSLERCGVAGVMRARVLEAAAALGIECRIVAGTRQDLLQADEIFLSNSLIGLWPVCRYGRRRLPAPGALCARLDRALAHPRLT